MTLLQPAPITLLSALAWLLIVSSPALGQNSGSTSDEFKSPVRTTEPLTSDAERAALKVPDGFRVTLFASEPQIQKPLNMAFDADGRLWVTGSNEYPFPAAKGEGTDTIRVLEDTNGDGRADKVTTFADDLNIPIGLYPYRDGVVVFSIPNILFLRDTDGDGKADQREVLYGPFDTSRDTHGMNNSFRRGFDGWLYCCHGFNNQSTVAGRDGHEVTLRSGNTYRIRLDGSRIEHFTHGQVNPFGMAIDANGDLMNSDCHTKPASLLIRDGYYESFGAAHDGLGFVPPVMDHLHGSTAIDGLCLYNGQAFPEGYRDDVFVGNVMTCRVHRNSIVRSGSSITLREEPDFLTSSDPWFRPVDIQIGPDGAMYVADFYNRIIGHYEVPLDHPGRDRERGRIWKIEYTGSAGNQTAAAPKLSDATLPTLLTTLTTGEQAIRQLAADQIVDRIGKSSVPSLIQTVTVNLRTTGQSATPQLLWCLHRLGSLRVDLLKTCYLKGHERTRIHVMRICSEARSGEEVSLLIRSGLQDPAALVRRAAADAAGQHPGVAVLKEVINASLSTSVDDVHLKHGLKIAMRNQLRDADVANWFASESQPAVASKAVAEVIPGLKAEHVADLVLSLLAGGHLTADQQPDMVRHAARYGNNAVAMKVVKAVEALPEITVAFRGEIHDALTESFRSRGTEPPPEFQTWSRELAESVFESVDLEKLDWGRYQLDERPIVGWGFEQRQPSRGGSSKTQFLSSLPGGERSVGVVRSRSFIVPFTLEFDLCGHLGSPDEPTIPANRVVLRDLATGAELQSALAPRNDAASRVVWDGKDSAGVRAYLEVVDGVDSRAYAWLAVARLSPSVVKTSEFDSGQTSALLGMAVRFLNSQQRNGRALRQQDVDRLSDIVKAVQVDGEVRAAAGQVLLKHHRGVDYSLLALPNLLKFATTPGTVETEIVEFCTSGKDKQIVPETLLRKVFSVLNQPLRKMLAAKLARNGGSAELLVTSVETGVPSAELFRDAGLVQQLSAHSPQVAERVKTLIAELPDDTPQTDQLAQNIIRRTRLGEGNAKAGAALFTKHCSVCHRRGKEGSLIGPQLDGIGTRGLTRLLEDILNPNRNVDVAFRSSVLVMQDGRILNGLVKPANPSGSVLNVIDTKGKTQEVQASDIDERKDSSISLMPANVSTLMNEDELLDLTLWLSK